MPRRIQRRRTKGWRMPEGAIYVGRPTRWGNPWTPGMALDLRMIVPPSAPDRDELGAAWRLVQINLGACIELYRSALTRSELVEPPLDFTIADAQRELIGRDLVCWCPLDQLCHADILLELANGEA